MAKYFFTNKAIEDLSNIWKYTLNSWSEQQADIYYKMLIDSCKKISQNPCLLGSKYDEIIDGLRAYQANRHVIFYLIQPDENILIVRILHQRMDYKKHLKA